MSEKHSNKQYVSARAMTPEDLMRSQNREVVETTAYIQKSKSGNEVFGTGLAGARLSSRAVRLSDEEPMTAAEIELLAGDSKLPDDFKMNEMWAGSKLHMRNQDPGRMVKTILATPSDFDRLIASADSLIVEMRRQNDLVSTLLLMLADARIEPANDFDANPGDSK